MRTIMHILTHSMGDTQVSFEFSFIGLFCKRDL